MTVPFYSIRAVEIGQRPVSLALPCHFGDTTVTETAEAYVRVTLGFEGREATGFAAQLMVPRWFDKRPDRTAAQTVDDSTDNFGIKVFDRPNLVPSVAVVGCLVRSLNVEENKIEAVECL